MNISPFNPRAPVWSNIWVLSLTSGLLVVSVLTALLQGLRIEATLAFLMPGPICSLVVTGGHGGSNADELIGGILAFAVNWLTYSFGALVVLTIGRAILKKLNHVGSRRGGVR